MRRTRARKLREYPDLEVDCGSLFVVFIKGLSPDRKKCQATLVELSV